MSEASDSQKMPKVDYRLRNVLEDAFENSCDDDLTEEEFPLFHDLKVNTERYDQASFLAKGGMKEVQKVFDHKTGRHVAMAVLHDGAPRELYEPFLREAMLTAKLEHPNIITVHDIGLDNNDHPYFTMELKVGDNLEDLLKNLDHKINLRHERHDLLEIFLKICDAVAYAHSRKVLHLDLKPSNIQVGLHGEVLVCDWGLGKLKGEEEVGAFDELLLNPDLLNNLTMSGQIKGTPGYMAPEQIEAEGCHSECTDVYALTCILHTLLSGRPPLSGATDIVLKKTVAGDLPNFSESFSKLSLPNGLCAVIKKGTSLRANDRYHSVSELAHEVKRFMAGRPTQAEEPGVFTLLSLFFQRNRLICCTVFLSVFLMMILTFLFILQLSSKEQAARQAQYEAEEMLELYEESNQKITSLADEYLNARANTAIELKQSSNFAAALTIFEQLSDAHPENKRLWREKANLHLSMMNFTEAHKCYDFIDSKGMGSEAARLFANKGHHGSFKASDYDVLFGLISDKWTNNRMLVSHGRMNTGNRKGHSVMVHAYLRHINPDWEDDIFDYTPEIRHLAIGGKGLKRFGISYYSKVFTGLRMQSMAIENTGPIDLKGISHLSLISLDIHSSKIEGLIFLNNFPSLGEIFVSPAQNDRIPSWDVRKRIKITVKDPD
ncbi:MAG: serine/threonine protein kinase [Planctomycetes bacterium]|nr:serine/threonine protein kinase [Planctomycetota bacterium]